MLCREIPAQPAQPAQPIGDIPAGAAVMSDTIAFYAILSVTDDADAQIDDVAYVLDANYQDNNADQAEAAFLDISGLIDSNIAPDEVMGFDVTHTDDNSSQTELLAIDIDGLADSVDVSSELAEFGYSGYSDASAEPSEQQSSNLTRWATTNSTSGTAPTNPTNAQGSNNGTVATCKAAGVLPVTPSTLNLNIVQPLTGAGSNPVFIAYYNNIAGVADTFTNQVSYRQSGQGNNTVLTLPTGNFLTDGTTVTLTNIDATFDVVAIFTHNATVAATGGSTTVDAVGLQSTGVL